MEERQRYQPKHGGKKKVAKRISREKMIRRIVSVSIAALLLIGIITLVVKIFTKDKGPEDVAEETTKKPKKSQSKVIDADEVVAEAKVLSTGDVLVHEMILNNSKDGSGYSFDKHFRAIKDEVSAADFAIANLEVTLGDTSKPYKCYPTFRSPDSIAKAIKNTGFDGVVTANNHCYDTAFEGLKRTVSVVDDLGLKHTGTRNDLSQKKYIVVDVNGIKIGIVNYAEETKSDAGRKALNGITLAAEANKYVNSWYSTSTLYSEMTENIKNMKADGAEVIMLYIHWGVEYSLTPSANQKEIAQKMCDLGVDVIIGGHPHVIQPATTLTSSDGSHKTFCIYSVGNLLSNQRTEYMGSACTTGHTEDAIFVYTTFTKYGDGSVKLTGVSYSPLWINRYDEGGSLVYEITNVSSPSKIKSHKEEAQKSLDRTNKLVKEGFDSFKSAA